MTRASVVGWKKQHRLKRLLLLVIALAVGAGLGYKFLVEFVPVKMLDKRISRSARDRK